MKREKKDDENANQFANLDKTSVVQEARLFNETPINARKCSLVLTKLLYMLGHGEQLGRMEATEAFFAVTKLWQSKDPTLRRLVYLAIKELCDKADDVIIVTSSLTKDMTGKEDAYRAPAIRALCKITDSGMLQAIERYMKQAIVDKHAAVASAAIVSSLHMLNKSSDVVRRWVNEVQEAVNNDNQMVQYHALCLLYHIRKSDRLAVNKLVQKFTKQGVRSPLALCYLIRIACKLIEDGESNMEAALFDFLETCLRHKSDIVIYEAANAITRLPNVTSKELAPAVSVLQLFCSSPKPSQRFAAVRTLSKISINHPAAVAACNMDLEQLITDTNRSIATLAITTLLKTGAEASVERLMKQINSFVSEIPDEFKIVVIQAIRSLCVRYPRKHAVMMTFLAQMLRDDGGYEYKKSIVDTIMTIISDNPEAKDTGLAHLCEFIEDCEHANLSTRVLHVLGREAPKTLNPRRYIRFVYNRVILEAPQVRAAAVTALAKFGAQCKDLSASIIVLLKRCLMDTDDEVRDRAAYYVTLLEAENHAANNNYILNGLQVSLTGLEKALATYCKIGGHQSKAFDLKSVAVAPQAISVLETKERPAVAEVQVKREEKPKASRQEMFAEKLSLIGEFAAYGPLLRSSDAVEMTESETEYVVHCIKHTFKSHLVLQFDCRNTLDDQLLDNVHAKVEIDEESGWRIVGSIPIVRLVCGELGTTYVTLSLPSEDAIEEDPSCLAQVWPVALKFVVLDCDPTTHEPDTDEGYDDDYQLEDVDVSVADYMCKVAKVNFNAAWQDNEAHSQESTYSLSTVNTIQEAVANLTRMLGMAVCERSDRVADGKLSHTLLMSAVYKSGDEVLVRAKFVADVTTGITMLLAIHSPSEEATALVASVFG